MVAAKSVDNQIMEQTTDCTTYDTEAVDQVDRQQMIEFYVGDITGRLVERPFDSAPQRPVFFPGGPCLSQEDRPVRDAGRPVFIPGGRIAPIQRTDYVPQDAPSHECDPAGGAE